MTTTALSERIDSVRQDLWGAKEDAAYQIAREIRRELNPQATDYRLDELAQAIARFLG